MGLNRLPSSLSFPKRVEKDRYRDWMYPVDTTKHFPRLSFFYSPDVDGADVFSVLELGLRRLREGELIVQLHNTWKKP